MMSGVVYDDQLNWMTCVKSWGNPLSFSRWSPRPRRFTRTWTQWLITRLTTGCGRPRVGTGPRISTRGSWSGACSSPSPSSGSASVRFLFSNHSLRRRNPPPCMAVTERSPPTRSLVTIIWQKQGCSKQWSKAVIMDFSVSSEATFSSDYFMIIYTHFS